MKNYINYIQIDKSRYIAKKTFLNNFKGHDVNINLPEDKFKNLVDDLFNNYNNEISNAMIKIDNDELNKIIRSSFRKDISNLNNFLEDNICITFVSKGVHEEDFKNIGIHKKDAELLYQAYILHLILDSPINFVTVDKGILELKNKILNDITSSIVVFDPIEFVSVNN